MKNIETFYPLSPLQKGLLFHTLASPASGLYFQQLNCVLRGKVDTSAWGRAWQSLVDLHPILRTSFVWEKVREPIQAVHREAKLQIDEQDWRELNTSDQKEKAEKYLRADRTRGFNISQAPLMRMALLRICDDAYVWVWSHHHLLMDGWSVQVLADQVFQLYEGYVKGKPEKLTASRPYKDYIAWLVRKDLASAERFWRSTLVGFKRANVLNSVQGSDFADEKEEEHADECVELSAPETESLQNFVRQYQLTLSTLAQAAWALLLRRYSGDCDVIFGITVAGRPPELDGVDTMVGLFINTQPMRVRITPGEPVVAWLKQIQAQCLTAQAYQYAPLQSIQEWSDLEPGNSLFETLVVFKNYPVRKGVDGTDGSLRVEGVRNYERTNFPLCLVVAVGERTEIQITYNRSRVAANVAKGMAQEFSRVLRALSDSAGRSVGELISHCTGGFRLAPQQHDLLQYIQSQSARASRVVTAVEVAGRIDASAFENACKRVGERYDILRTRCERSEEMRVPLQVVGPGAKTQIEIIHMSDRSEDDRQAEMIALAEKHSAMSSDPVLSGFRVSLVNLGEEKSGLILSIQPVYGDIRTAHNLVGQLLAECGETSIDPDTQERLQYSSYSEWQNDLLDSEIGQNDGGRWKDAQLPSINGMPFIDPEAKGHYEPASTETLNIDAELAERVEGVVRQFETSVEVFLLSCWALLLSRMSGESRVTIPVVFDGRTDEDLERGIGLFERHLPLSFDWDNQVEFGAWLKTVETTARDAYHAQNTFEWNRVRRSTETDRSITEACSFRYIDHGDASHLSELEWKVIWEKTTTYDFICELICARRRQGLLLSIDYDRHRIRKEEASRLLEYFKTVLAAASATPALQVDSIELCDEVERRRLLLKSNPVAIDFQAGEVMPQMLRALVSVDNSREAVSSGRERLTARQLHEKSNQLARRLIEMGAEPERLVGISLERSIDMVISVLAVLKAGAAYVPLDLQYPEERLRYMLEDASPCVIVTQSRFRDRLPVGAERLLCLDTDSAWCQQPTDDVDVAVRPDNVAYVIYTSGTTGRPKGAAITHRALCNHMSWMLAEFGFTEADRILQRTPFSFDASVWELYAPLLSGGTLVMYSADPHQIPAELVAAIRRDNITVIQIVPTMLRMLLDDAAFTSCESLQYVFCGGEVLSVDLQTQFARQLPCAQLINLYGPTETCIDATFWNCSTSVNSKDVPIGTPIANDRLYVLDDHRRLLPAGVRGQLFVAGDGLGRGYWDRPALTAERFLPDPFSSRAGERMYKTGDLGCWTEDGAFHCIGRVDNQVKLRGFRIELGEIESVLGENPQVAQVVVVHRAEEKSSQLIAYIVPREPAASPTIADLRAWLQQRLPEYMIPTVFTFIPSLPLLPSGKLDRRALPDPALQEEVPSSVQVPRNAKEQQISDIWKTLLRISELSIDDNFFEMGGDSILTLQVTARAAEAGLQITPRQIFENPTVESLAAVVEYARPAQEEPRKDEIESGEIPLTPIQRDFFERKYPDRNHYNQAALFRLLRPIDLGATEKVFAHLIAHHDALRLRFHHNNSEWIQTVEPEETNRVVEFANDREHALLKEPGGIEAMCDRFQASLDIEHGPLLRAVVMERQGEAYLLIVIHHLATDAVSWNVILEDLTAAYDQVGKGERIELRVPATSFRKWSRKLTDYGRSEDLLTEESYWTSEGRSHVSTIPTDFPDRNNLESSERTVASVLDSQATDLLLRELPGAYHAQVKEVLLGALAHGLSRWVKDGRLLINVEGHGREPLGEHLDLSRTVGWFTSLVPVYLKFDPSDDPRSTLRMVKEQFRAIPGNGIGHGALLHLSGRVEIQKRLSELPKAEICLNYLGHSGPQSASESWVIPATQRPGACRHREAQRIYLLDVQASIADGRLRIDWHYSDNVHKPETVEELSRNVMAALRLLIDLSASSPEIAFAPSDFPNAQLSQKDLDSLMARIPS